MATPHNPGDKTINLLIVNGLDDKSNATILSTKGEVKFMYTGNLDMYGDINDDRLRKAQVLLGCANPQKATFPVPNLAFNCIADPDSHARSLKLATRLFKSVAAPVLNRPEKINATTRDNIYRLFHECPGLQVPRTLRVQPESLHNLREIISAENFPYPFLMRPAGIHGGHNLTHVQHPEDLGLLERYAFDGSSYYLTEFVDFRSADGLYRKYRLVVIDGQIYPRHMIVSDHWNVHSRSRQQVMANRPDLIAQERDFIDHPLEAIGESGLTAIRHVHATLGLDYFGIDCNLPGSSNLIIFEINACVNIMQKNQAPFLYLDPVVENIRSAVVQMIIARSC